MLQQIESDVDDGFLVVQRRDSSVAQSVTHYSSDAGEPVERHSRADAQ